MNRKPTSDLPRHRLLLAAILIGFSTSAPSGAAAQAGAPPVFPYLNGEWQDGRRVLTITQSNFAVTATIKTGTLSCGATGISSSGPLNGNELTGNDLLVCNPPSCVDAGKFPPTDKRPYTATVADDAMSVAFSWTEQLFDIRKDSDGNVKDCPKTGTAQRSFSITRECKPTSYRVTSDALLDAFVEAFRKRGIKASSDLLQIGTDRSRGSITFMIVLGKNYNLLPAPHWLLAQMEKGALADGSQEGSKFVLLGMMQAALSLCSIRVNTRIVRTQTGVVFQTGKGNADLSPSGLERAVDLALAELGVEFQPHAPLDRP